ncbi:MAG: hypothetical protein AMS27_15610 [Bacteroides sp. SM23_62_1]|nr:MAG: hypothetical protein AMS27_15610 [Bacteroides sp. SM23_62_1]
MYCYVTCRGNDADRTGVIIVHEDWGLTDWIKSFSEQIAELGHLVIAPDFLSWQESGIESTEGFMNEDLARRSLMNIGHDQIIKDLDAAYHYLRNHSLCNGKVVVIGFAWGAGQVFDYMTGNPDLSAGFVFYGKPASDNKKLEKITAPVYGFYGEYDSRINSSILRTSRRMNKSGINFEPVIYEGGGHGFMRSGERPGANEGNIKARSAAWKRLKELLSIF